MVPTMRPSAKTSIFAPTRCGVEPVVETMVTSAAASPRSSAAATAAKTSRFIYGDYRSRSPVQFTQLRRFRADEERFADDLRAVRRRELAGLGVDVHEADPLGDV